MIPLPQWVYKKIFKAIISWPILSSHNIISLKSLELLPRDSHPRFISDPRIVYVFHRDLISFAVNFPRKNYFHRCPRDIVLRPELYPTPPPYQSSCFVVGSTFFRSACADAGPIFQRIIRIPLSRDRIYHPMRFSLFLPDCMWCERISLQSHLNNAVEFLPEWRNISNFKTDHMLLRSFVFQ